MRFFVILFFVFSYSTLLFAESLNEELAARAAASKAKAPAASKEVMRLADRELATSNILEKAPSIGTVLPDATFVLPDGSTTTLYSATEGKPAIVTFYRGAWCPYCNIQLLSYQKHLPKITAAGGTLIAISPELPDNSISMVQKNKLAFTVLSDQNNSYAREIGIVFPINDQLKQVYLDFGIDLQKANGSDAWELPLAASFVLDSEHRVRYAFVDTDYKKRAEPAELVTELEKIRVP